MHSLLEENLKQENITIKQVFASKGKAVMFVRYHGYADLDSVVEATAEKIILHYPEEADVAAYIWH